MCFLVFFYILFLKYQYYLFHYVASHGLGLNKKGWRARTSKYWKLRREIEMSSRECYLIQQKDSCPWVGTHRQKRHTGWEECVWCFFLLLSPSLPLFTHVNPHVILFISPFHIHFTWSPTPTSFPNFKASNFFWDLLDLPSINAFANY